MRSYPRTHTVIARRKGDNWFVGGIASKEKTVNCSFDFLKKGTTYTATIYKDRENRKMAIEKKEIESSDSIVMTMLDRGGFTISLEPKK